VDLLAGMVAASIGILDEYNFAINDNDNRSIKKEYSLNTDIDISQYRILHNISEREISLHGGKIAYGFYGVWLRSKIQYHYDLYTFKTNDFFQGIINFCQMLNVDFRSYMYNSPIDSSGNSLFDLKIKELAIDVPDRQYEILEEERGNENVIEPLTKDY
jgi:hypothetical protein